MLKTKSKSPKQISKKKTKEKYPRELIEQVYKMTYAILNLKYRDSEMPNSEIEGKAIDRGCTIISE